MGLTRYCDKCRKVIDSSEKMFEVAFYIKIPEERHIESHDVCDTCLSTIQNEFRNVHTNR